MESYAIVMRKYILTIFLAIGYLCSYAQVFDMLNSDLYRGRVKLVSEFMKRFNGEEKNPYIDPNAEEIDKINLCQLFDADFIIKNRTEIEPKAFQFVDSVLNNNVKINYSDPNWFAKTSCVATFKGKEIKFDIYLVVEPRGKDMFKWVIADVKGDIFNLKPSRESEKIMLLPNEHESNFMRLNSITSEKDDYITLYSSHTSAVDRLTVFNTLIYYGFLNIEYVSDIEYTFLQVPGYAFTIKEFERESTNSGWLIESWQQMDTNEKNLVLNDLYHGKYMQNSAKIHEPEPIITKTEKNDVACTMVNKFISLLSNYASNKDKATLDSINNAVKGRYTFIITDEVTNQLAKFFNSKAQKSYKMDTLTGWLGSVKSPIQSISINNVKPFEHEYVRPEYSDGYTLISGDLSTEGDLQVNEQVVFFIYENQIAGIKLISDCF